MLRRNDDDFDVFKSNVCHNLRILGDICFINEILENETIEKYFLEKKYANSLYLLAIVDYLCRVNNIVPPEKFCKMRTLKFKKPILPKSVMLESYLSTNEPIIQMAIENSIPEFIRFNIVEGDIRDVV